jgi:hypothetical protein
MITGFLLFSIALLTLSIIGICNLISQIEKRLNNIEKKLNERR